MRKQFWEGMFRSFGTGARAHPSAVRAARLREGGPPIAPEDLEARRHLSVSTSLSGGVLTVTGDSNAQEIIVWRSTGPGTDTLKVREILNGNENDSVAYQTSQVNSISVSAGSGNDTITVETNALNPLGTTGVGKPVTAFGQDGDDTINGGDGADDLHGDYGNDTIYCGPGTNRVDGGPGTDTAVFIGARANYTVHTVSGVATVSGTEGTTSLSTVETLRFNDGTYATEGFT